MKKRGIALIVLAVVIVAAYLMLEFVLPRLTSTEPVIMSDMSTASPAVSGNYDSLTTLQPEHADVWLSKDKIIVSKYVLTKFKVSRSKFAKEIITFTNSYGYSGSEQVEVIDDTLTHDKAYHTYTVTRRAKQGKQDILFDVVYQYKIKNWQFKPY